jgi:hypothetical protein
MKLLKTTPWLSGEEKPLSDRIGPYERDYTEEQNGFKTYWCWWDGNFFGFPANSPKASKQIYKLFGHSDYQNLPWRGALK